VTEKTLNISFSCGRLGMRWWRFCRLYLAWFFSAFFRMGCGLARTGTLTVMAKVRCWRTQMHCLALHNVYHAAYYKGR